jgi:hypothetical protein
MKDYTLTAVVIALLLLCALGYVHQQYIIKQGRQIRQLEVALSIYTGETK